MGAFLLLQPAGETAFPWLALISPGAMFFLIAVFWRLNASAYHVYGPLFLAGKGLSIITTIFWLFFTKSSMIRELVFHETAVIIVPGIVFFMVLGDMLSVWLVSRLLSANTTAEINTADD